MKKNVCLRRLTLVAIGAAVLLTPKFAAAATVYWGGGSINLTGSSDPLNPAIGGTWSTTIANWGDTSTGIPNTYQAWVDGDIASFGATNSGPTINLTSGTKTVSGISTYLFSGAGTGTITITGTGTGAGAGSINLASGGSFDIVAGNTIRFFNTGGQTKLNVGDFTKTGGGKLLIESYQVIGTGTTGTTVTIDDGEIQAGGNAMTLFTNQTINLTGAGAVFSTVQGSASSGFVGTPVGALTGTTGTVRGNGYIRLVGAGNSTFDGTITDSPGGTLSIMKSGTGKVSWSNPANNQTGSVVVFNGTLEATGTGAGSGKIMLVSSGRGTSRIFGSYQNTGGTLDERGTVAAMFGGVIKGGNLSVANLENQVQVMSGGLLQFDASSEIPGSGRVLDGSQDGAILSAGYAIDNAFLARTKESFRGTVALAADSSNDLDFSSTSGLNSADVRLGAVSGTWTYSGNITPNGSTYRLGGGNGQLIVSNALADGVGSRNLEVGAESNFGQNVMSIFHSTGAAVDSPRFINLRGTGVDGAQVAHATLTSANTFTGSTTVGPFSVLELSGVNGALANTSDITVHGGVLYLNDRTGATNANRLNDAAAIVVNQGGQINYRGTGGNTETTGTLTLASGQTFVTTARDGGTGDATLALGGFARNTGATLRTNIGTSTAVVVAGIAPATGGDDSALGGWAVANGGVDWATVVGGTFGRLITYTSGTNPTWASTNNISLTTSGTTVVTSGNQTIYSLRNSGASPATLDLNGLAFTVDGGGIMNANGGSGSTFTIKSNAGNATLTAGNAAGGGNYELFFWGAGTNRSISIADTVTVTDNGINPVAVVASGNVAADGGVALSLTGSNSYSGGTYINTSVVSAHHANALGTGTVYINGFHDAGVDNGQYALSELQLAGNAVGARTLANPIEVNAYGLLALSGSGTWTTSGPITLNNESILRVGQVKGSVGLPSAPTLNSQITGNGGLAFWISGTMGGAANNDYTGDTTVINGTITLKKTSGNAIGGNLNIGGFTAVSTPSDMMVVLGGSDQIADTSVVTMVGGGISGGQRGVLRLAGNSDTIAGLVSTVGNGIVQNSLASTTGVLTISPAAQKSYSFGGQLQNGAGTGSVLSIVKAGLGTQILTGSNTYTGSTTVAAGTLLANNATGSATGTGAVTVNAGATLGGNGIITGAVSVSGTVAPGENTITAGTLTINNNVTFGTGGTLSIKLDNNGNTGDLLAISGNLDLSGGTDALTISLLNTTPSSNFIIASYTGSLIGTFDSVTGLPAGYSIDYGVLNANAITLVIPEPSAFVMLAGGIGILTLFRRRKG